MNEIVGGGRAAVYVYAIANEFYFSTSLIFFSVSWLRCKIFFHILNITKIGILINKREHNISSDDWNFQLKVKNWHKKVSSCRQLFGTLMYHVTEASAFR